MERYEDSFLQAGINTVDQLAQISTQSVGSSSPCLSVWFPSTLRRHSMCDAGVTLFSLFCRDLLHMGVTLAGHQRKILSSIQTMPVRNKGTTTVTF